MGQKIAIDFGTTNSVIARWSTVEDSATFIDFPGISLPGTDGHPPTIPSLVYVHDGESGHVSVGQSVPDGIRDHHRLFRNFKRGIVAMPPPPPREIDGREWSQHDAGRSFLRSLLEALPYKPEDIEQLVLTAPVAAFESYLHWLNDVVDNLSHEVVRIIDESTAAALGYAVTKPGAIVLVFDFGGGTLDLSLVQLPESKANTGGFLRRLRLSRAGQHTARVIAKAGRIIGGSDIDQWLLAFVLEKANLAPADLGHSYSALLARCEQAKIALSTQTNAAIDFEAGDRRYHVVVARSELEALLEENEFYNAVRRVVDKVMHVARQGGIFKEDIHYVLMVGGISLMPSIQRVLSHYFSDMAVRADKPFTAVAEGALQMAAGYGLDDYLVHSYGLRHLDPESGQHAYDEIVAMGSRYPGNSAVEVILGAAHENQDEIEFVVGEIDSDAVTMVEVEYIEGQPVFVAKANDNSQIIAVNQVEAANILARLTPPGKPGQDRVKARFMVDEGRRLCMTVIDMQTGKKLLDDVVVATLR